MKRLTEKQKVINHQLTKLMVDNKNDEETHTALVCAQCAFFNYINTGEKVDIKVTPTPYNNG